MGDEEEANDHHDLDEESDRIREEPTKPMGHTNMDMDGRKQLYLSSCAFVIFIWSLVVIVSFSVYKFLCFGFWM